MGTSSWGCMGLAAPQHVESSQTRDQTCGAGVHWQTDSYPLYHQGSPHIGFYMTPWVYSKWSAPDHSWLSLPRWQYGTHHLQPLHGSQGSTNFSSVHFVLLHVFDYMYFFFLKKNLIKGDMENIGKCREKNHAKTYDSNSYCPHFVFSSDLFLYT